jgi:putative NADPH-quinone reductase
MPPVRVLVVHAHPDPGSFNGALYRAAVDALESAGHEVDALDLYAEEFDPVMSRAEREAYETDSPICSPEVARHVELVRRAEGLVFVYPTWWGGLPAILKGWLDRVLVPGVAFTLDDTSRVKPAMQHVQRVVGVTTYGSAPWYVRVVGDAGRRTIARTVWMNCRRRSRPWWLAMYRLDSASRTDCEAFLARVTDRLARL